MKELESNPATRIVWNSVKPMLMGQILYAPDSPAVRKIIRNVSGVKNISGYFCYFVGFFKEIIFVTLNKLGGRDRTILKTKHEIILSSLSSFAFVSAVICTSLHIFSRKRLSCSLLKLYLKEKISFPPCHVWPFVSRCRYV